MLKAVEKALEADLPMRESGDLWPPSPQRSYQQWVCGLTGSLLGCTSGPNKDVLRVCHRLVRLKPAFAEFIFPHALANIAAAKHTQDPAQVTLRYP